MLLRNRRGGAPGAVEEAEGRDLGRTHPCPLTGPKARPSAPAPILPPYGGGGMGIVAVAPRWRIRCLYTREGTSSSKHIFGCSANAHISLQAEKGI